MRIQSYSQATKDKTDESVDNNTTTDGSERERGGGGGGGGKVDGRGRKEGTVDWKRDGKTDIPLYGL